MIKVKNMSMGRQEAFEIFKRDYSENEELEDQKSYLKKNYTEAKLLGEQINTTRTKLSINILYCIEIFRLQKLPLKT